MERKKALSPSRFLTKMEPASVMVVQQSLNACKKLHHPTFQYFVDVTGGGNWTVPVQRVTDFCHGLMQNFVLLALGTDPNT